MAQRRAMAQSSSLRRLRSEWQNSSFFANCEGVSSRNAIYQPVGPNYFATDLPRYFFHGRQ